MIRMNTLEEALTITTWTVRGHASAGLLPAEMKDFDRRIQKTLYWHA